MCCSSGCSASTGCGRRAGWRGWAGGSRASRSACRATSSSPRTCIRSGWPGASGTCGGREQFFADADAGTLPAFSIVDPDFDVFSEENPQDIRKGESFAAEVVRHVMHGKGWPHTLAIWVYDEGGGYYDHVPPPEAIPPDDVPAHNPLLSSPGWFRAALRPLIGSYLTKVEEQDAGPAAYDRYGFRVPAVIVSPYARPDYVTSTVYDHTSILKLVQQKWNLPALTRRDAAATSPLDAIDFDGRARRSSSPRTCPRPAWSGATGPAERAARFARARPRYKPVRIRPTGRRRVTGGNPVDRRRGLR